MDNIETSRMRRFIESPWAIALASAGAVGAITLVAMLLLRKRNRSREQSRQIKDIATSFSGMKDETSALIQAGQEIATVVDPTEVEEVARIFQQVAAGTAPDESTQALAVIAAVASEGGRKRSRSAG